MPFRDRAEAGRHLAARLAASRGGGGRAGVVAGLPRGGVPVAFEVARALAAPLDVLLVRKLGAPGQPELAMGAVGEGGVRVLNQEVIDSVGPSAEELESVERAELAELERQARRFRGGRPPVPLAGREVIVVDDGIATGSTARAACRVARAAGAARVVMAAPVASPRALEELRADTDEVVCLDAPEWFFAIGQLYADFSQTSDEEVVDLLDRAAQALATGSW